MYALILNDTIQSVGSLPRAARHIDTGQWVMPPDGVWTAEQAEACGYFYVVPAVKPPDSATDTSDSSVELVDGVPMQVWTSRPWTEDELKAQRVAVLQMEQAAALAALTPEQTDALLGETAPPAGEPWRQPTGAYDSYPTGAQVTHVDKTWESTVTANVWEPGVSGWRETGSEWPDWVQPAGAEDAYPQGAKVTHNEVRWVSEVPSNVWEPGVYGWVSV